MGPYLVGSLPIERVGAVDRRGVEPRFPACDAGVVPLDQQPIGTVQESRLDRLGSRTPISWLQARRHPVRPAAHSHSIGRSIGPRSARESNSVPLLTTEACRRRTRGPSYFRPGEGPPESRTRPPCLQGRHAPHTPADHRVVPEGVEPPFPLCKRGVVAIGPRDVVFSFDSFPDLWSSTGGSRTHRHQTLSLTAIPVRVPCHRIWVS